MNKFDKTYSNIMKEIERDLVTEAFYGPDSPPNPTPGDYSMSEDQVTFKMFYKYNTPEMRTFEVTLYDVDASSTIYFNDVELCDITIEFDKAKTSIIEIDSEGKTIGPMSITEMMELDGDPKFTSEVNALDEGKFYDNWRNTKDRENNCPEELVDYVCSSLELS